MICGSRGEHFRLCYWKEFQQVTTVGEVVLTHHLKLVAVTTVVKGEGYTDTNHFSLKMNITKFFCHNITLSQLALFS